MKTKQVQQNLNEKAVDATKLFGKISVATGVTLFAATATTRASGDYGPAIWNPNCGQYNTSGYGHKFHVVHDMEGYYASTISYFKNCNTQASVHYCVNGKQDASSDAPAGEITQMVSEANYAWHALCWNGHSTGTEHEGFASNPAWYTETMYQASAGISRHEADKFGYPKDRNHIVAHGQKSVAGWSSWASANLGIDPNCNTHTDPGAYWDWGHYMALVNGNSWGGPRPFGPVAINAAGVLNVFGLANDGGTVQVSWQTAPNSGFSAWTTMQAGYQAKKLAVVSNADGRVQVFSINLGNYVDTSCAVNPDGSGGFGAWTRMGGTYQATNILAARNADGRLQLFTLNTVGGIDTCWQTSPGGSWTAWSGINPGYAAKDLAVGYNANGSIQLFAINTGGYVDNCSQPGGSSGFGTWSRLIAGNYQAQKVVAGQNQNGCISVFTLNLDNHIDIVAQTSPNGNWGTVTGINSWYSAQSVSVGSNADGRLQLFTVNLSNGVDSCAQTTANGGWGSMFAVGSPQYMGIPRVIGGNSQDGRLFIFCRAAADNSVSACWQTAINGGFSSVWGGMGGSLSGL